MASDNAPPLAGHVAIFGGSFDPPHLGHQMGCLYLLEGLGADRVWLMPAVVHPFAKPMTEFATRLEMCRLLAQPFGRRVRVCDTEARLGGEGRTYDLLMHLRRRYPRKRFALAVGADILGETRDWYRWEEIDRLATVVILGRGGFRDHADARITPMELPALASRDLRARALRGESLVGLVPHRIASFIRARSLYTTG